MQFQIFLNILIKILIRIIMVIIMSLIFLCLKIFFVRIIDVSLGTFRTIITVKGKAFYASIIGFI